ncbi:MAG: cupin domain-containing protein, partial [Porphyrobacter sp.]|nr:cupin domain-containing protein [Porphyrobacter sp.]
MSDSAQSLIEQLQLSPHPEGGWYRETWRAASDPGTRAGGTAILFLLKMGEASHWHRVDADELWLWQSGDPLELRIAASDHGPVETVTMGGNVAAGERLQALVPQGAGQAARSLGAGTGAAG